QLPIRPIPATRCPTRPRRWSPKPSKSPGIDRGGARWPACLSLGPPPNRHLHWRADGGLPETPRLKKPGKLANSIFFRTQLTASFVVTALNEFANRGKL